MKEEEEGEREEGEREEEERGSHIHTHSIASERHNLMHQNH